MAQLQHQWILFLLSMSSLHAMLGLFIRELKMGWTRDTAPLTRYNLRRKYHGCIEAVKRACFHLLEVLVRSQ